MKTTALFIVLLLLASCGGTPKDFSTVSQGMTQQEVIRQVGEPALRKDIEVAILWTYPQHDRTVVFRADTVYDIMTSREAREDSIKASLQHLGRDIKKGAKKIGSKLDSAGERLIDKLEDDTAGKQ
ncbi:MAG TPA: hypothetical protein VGE26_00460 [Sphingobacteriaceae bacterium]